MFIAIKTILLSYADYLLIYGDEGVLILSTTLATSEDQYTESIS
jgi:hypothetical protein